MPNDHVSIAAKVLQEQLKQLQQEQTQLERALRALGNTTNGSRSPQRSSGASRPRAQAAGGRRGHRAAQVIGLLHERPGLRASEIASTLGISGPNAYQLLKRMQNQGQLRKDGLNYYVADNPAPSDEASEPAAATGDSPDAGGQPQAEDPGAEGSADLAAADEDGDKDPQQAVGDSSSSK